MSAGHAQPIYIALPGTRRDPLTRPPSFFPLYHTIILRLMCGYASCGRVASFGRWCQRQPLDPSGGNRSARPACTSSTRYARACTWGMPVSMAPQVGCLPYQYHTMRFITLLLCLPYPRYPSIRPTSASCSSVWCLVFRF
jgi:hypothetical protein